MNFKDWKGHAGLSTLGLNIVLSVLFGFGAGYWLDGKLGTEPWLSVVGFGFGLAAATRFLLEAMRQMRAVAEREEREEGNPAPLFDPELDPGDAGEARSGEASREARGARR